MSDLPPDAAARINRGQALEAEASPANLAAALHSYDEALALLQIPRWSTDLSARRELGVAWMNRGSVLLKQNTHASLSAAVQAYDKAIALLGISAFEKYLSARNHLGASWMNRGLALHRLSTPGKIDEAIRSQRTAIAVLETLPPVESPWYRRNLAAAQLNLAERIARLFRFRTTRRVTHRGSCRTELNGGSGDNRSHRRRSRAQGWPLLLRCARSSTRGERSRRNPQPSVRRRGQRHDRPRARLCSVIGSSAA